MIAFDTDIMSRILWGDPALGARLANIPLLDQSVPIVVVDEILRGRLNVVRQAEAGKAKVTLETAYALLERSLRLSAVYRILAYDGAADALMRNWRQQKIRVGTKDMRIGSICVAHGVKLITDNRQDFGQLPGLNFEVWK